MLSKSFIFLIALFLASGCGNRFVKSPNHNGLKSEKELMKPYKKNGKWYYPKKVTVGEKFQGIVSWYGDEFHGKQTANGEIFNMYNLTAAHTTLPMNTILLVRNLENNKTVVVRVNDRGPFVKNRILDLSKEAGKKLGIIKKGTAQAEITVIGYNGVRDEKLLKIETTRLKPKNTSEPTSKMVQKNTTSIKHNIKTLPEQPEEIKKSLFSKPKIETTSSDEVDIITEPDEVIVLIEDVNVTKKISLEPQVDNILILPQENEKNNTVEIIEEPTDSNDTINMAKSDFEEANESDVLDEKITSLVIKPQVELPFIQKNKIIKRFYVQVGSFRNRDGAERMIYQYKEDLPKSLKLIVKEENNFFKVWVAGFNSKEEASEFNSKKDIFGNSFLIIRSEKQ